MTRIIAKEPVQAASREAAQAAVRPAKETPRQRGARSSETAREAAPDTGQGGLPAAPDTGQGGVEAAVVLRAAEGAGERLDRFLAARLPALLPDGFAQVSRTRIQRWIALGAVSCDERVVPASTRLAGFETITVEPQPREADSAFVAEPVPVPVVWRDESLLVIDKPAGLVVHPGAGNWSGTLLNGLLALDAALAALPRAGIVHRLDKDTSGLLVVARTEAAMVSLSAQLADRSMGRRYLAVVMGFAPASGVVDAAIGRDDRSRVRMAVVPDARGRAARTHFRRLAHGHLAGTEASLLECRLETGRTHQIRVHLAHVGHPLVGDISYGGAPLGGFTRQALHAWRLSLTHPADRRTCGWTSAPPADLLGLLQAAGIDLACLPIDPEYRGGNS